MNEQRRHPVGQSIGRPMPAANPNGPVHPLVAQMLNSVMQGSTGMLLDPEMFASAPPWVAALCNHVQNLEAQVAILRLTLLRRGLITEDELLEVTVQVNQKMQEQFVAQLNALDGHIKNRQPQQDPRRPPQP